METQHTQDRPKQNWFRRHSRALLIAVGGLVVVTAVLWQRCGVRGCPDVDRLKAYMPDEASTVVDHQGREIGKLFLTKRVIVQLDSLPEQVPEAFIAMEDKRFWSHDGIDWRRVLGAAWRNVRALGIEEGSSTITMQLARNAFPEQLPANKRTFLRKLAEAKVAGDIERKFTKQEILQLYLNQIYFGNGAYGIEAAAQEYFGKSAAELKLSEAAILAALPRAPSRLNPRNNRELALEGRDLVLKRMAEQGLITRDEAEAASKARLRLRKGSQRMNQAAPYFVEAVRQILEEEVGDAIYTKGLTIHTTLDRELQRALEEELTQQLRAIEAGAYGTFRHTTLAREQADTSADPTQTRYLQAAGVFMDARTGDVRALVGGRSFEDSEFNRALNAQRQAGSAFKPFVYAAAFSQGYAPTHQLIDRPLRLVLSRRNVWEPKNYDGSYAGVVSMRDALAHSKNVPTIRLATEIGISSVIDMARQMGLSGRIPAVPSVVLGTAEVTPIEMATAFAGFATLGERPAARFVTRVEDRAGNVIWSSAPAPSAHVLDPAVAFMTVSLMQDVVDRGTGTAVRAVGYRYPAAGKTGTTNDVADIWFVGMTPEIVGTIWMGFDKRKTILPRATGGELAAPVWGRVMRRAGPASNGWAPPPGIEMRLVDINGNVMSDNCPAVGPTRQEYFLEGTAPFATCYPSYSAYAYDSLYGIPDTASYGGADDDGWWERMRRRIFRRDAERPIETEPIEDEELPPVRRDTVRPPLGVPAPIDPKPAPRTQEERPRPRPVPFDSVRPRQDTTKSPKPAPDTTTAQPDTVSASR